MDRAHSLVLAAAKPASPRVSGQGEGERETQLLLWVNKSKGGKGGRSGRLDLGEVGDFSSFWGRNGRSFAGFLFVNVCAGARHGCVWRNRFWFGLAGGGGGGNEGTDGVRACVSACGRRRRPETVSACQFGPNGTKPACQFGGVLGCMPVAHFVGRGT